MTVAIVIPTYNSGRTLRACLESIRCQTLQAAEVVLVDDVRTADDTRHIAREYGVRLIVSPAGTAQSRNEGVEASSAPLLLSIDSDMILPPHLAQEVVDTLGDRWLDALSIREETLAVNYWSRARALDKWGVETTGHGRALRAFTRAVFTAVEGFDPQLHAGEDLDFHLRVAASGARVGHIDSLSLFHDEGHLNLTQAWRKKYVYGKTLRAFERRHGRQLVDGLGSRIAAGVRRGMAVDPLAVPGFLTLKALEGVAGYLGRAQSN